MHKQGLKTTVADVLSRLPPYFEFSLLSMAEGLSVTIFVEHVCGDEALRDMIFIKPCTLVNQQPKVIPCVVRCYVTKVD